MSLFLTPIMALDNVKPMPMVINLTKANIIIFLIQAIFITLIVYFTPKAGQTWWQKNGPYFYLGMTLCIYLLFPLYIICYTLKV
jgi:hypothetical protein